ncbi:hypothetical protein [Sporomusa malonica]|uniref:Uncharacterized protein n=1 Tax=Sporomusa malonica TaxID=112901 RepID=A0A1W1ZEX7_9FIRM|nr:hypothetical protein [Sporomusa malonica]SMC46772.1 hypothetical protein SAMN04488500_103232 [Sporomusa malonica]
MDKLTDAVVFSKTHHIDFEKAVTKPILERLARQLIQDIGRPLSHNGIIVGHIKVLVKLSDEEFLFVSITRLDQVDFKMSSHWTTGLDNKYSSIKLDINVLIFGHSEEAIEKVVDGSLANLRRDSMCQDCTN